MILLALLDAHRPSPLDQQVFHKLIAPEQMRATLALFLPESEADRFQ